MLGRQQAAHVGVEYLVGVCLLLGCGLVGLALFLDVAHGFDVGGWVDVDV